MGQYREKIWPDMVMTIFLPPPYVTERLLYGANAELNEDVVELVDFIHLDL